MRYRFVSRGSIATQATAKYAAATLTKPAVTAHATVTRFRSAVIAKSAQKDNAAVTIKPVMTPIRRNAAIMEPDKPVKKIKSVAMMGRVLSRVHLLMEKTVIRLFFLILAGRLAIWALKRVD